MFHKENSVISETDDSRVRRKVDGEQTVVQHIPEEWSRAGALRTAPVGFNNDFKVFAEDSSSAVLKVALEHFIDVLRAVSVPQSLENTGSPGRVKSSGKVNRDDQCVFVFLSSSVNKALDCVDSLDSVFPFTESKLIIMDELIILKVPIKSLSYQFIKDLAHDGKEANRPVVTRVRKVATRFGNKFNVRLFPFLREVS